MPIRRRGKRQPQASGIRWGRWLAFAILFRRLWVLVFAAMLGLLANIALFGERKGGLDVAIPKPSLQHYLPSLNNDNTIAIHYAPPPVMAADTGEAQDKADAPPLKKKAQSIAYPAYLGRIIDSEDWQYVRSALVAANGLGEGHTVRWNNAANQHRGTVTLMDAAADCQLFRVSGNRGTGSEIAHLRMCDDGKIE